MHAADIAEDGLNGRFVQEYPREVEFQATATVSMTYDKKRQRMLEGPCSQYNDALQYLIATCPLPTSICKEP